MSTAPLVSVITPAYNVAAWIGEAIDSVLGQTESRLEYVVVDDGSTDGTADIVAERATRDPRLRLIRTPNGGSGQARNIAIEDTSAPFVAFLDGDDRWHPDFLRTALTKLQQAPPEVGATFSHTRVLLESGRLVGLRWLPAGPCDLDRLLIDHNPPHNGSSLLLRRSCFTEVGVFDAGLRSGVDFDMWLRIAAKSSMPVFLGIRRWHVDMRLMRTGSISLDRSARYRALDRILAEYSPMMRHSQSGLAYVRPAVFAYRDGRDDLGDIWAKEALTAGVGALRRDVWGLSMLAWTHAGPARRARMRNLRNTTRAGVYRGLGTAARVIGG
jgi:glycosyltransferase involved in cell wall biosynthesis